MEIGTVEARVFPCISSMNISASFRFMSLRIYVAFLVLDFCGLMLLEGFLTIVTVMGASNDSECSHTVWASCNNLTSNSDVREYKFLGRVLVPYSCFSFAWVRTHHHVHHHVEYHQNPRNYLVCFQILNQ